MGQQRLGGCYIAAEVSFSGYAETSCLPFFLWEGCSSALQGDLLYNCWILEIICIPWEFLLRLCHTAVCVIWADLLNWLCALWLWGHLDCPPSSLDLEHMASSVCFKGVASPLWLPCSLLLQGYTRKAETFLPEAGEQIQSLADLEQWTDWRRCASRTHASTEPAPVADLQKCHRQNESSGNSQTPQVWQALIQPHLLCKTGPFISSSYLCPTPNNMGLLAVLLGG